MLADRTTEHILDALRRAAAEPAGTPLYAVRGGGGLFPTTAAGKLAARRCLDDGYLRVVSGAARGKATQEVCALTDTGQAYLLSAGDSRRLLEDLVRAVEGREEQLAALRTNLAGLRELAEKLLPVFASNGQAHAGHVEANNVLLGCLSEWQASEDCPLPELYRQARTRTPLTLGQFHDALRALKEAGRIYLHPWTGPLYTLPEPECALLSGHEVTYYASTRSRIVED